MGLSEISIWVLVRRYDQLKNETDKVSSTLKQVTVPSVLTFAELKNNVLSWAEVEDDNTKVVKVRRFDNSLIPLSALLQGSSKDKPFIMDVVEVHQFCPVEKRSVPPEYVDAIKSKLTNLEKRVFAIEVAIPDIESSHLNAVEDAANKLANCIGFIDKRFDDLTPPEWMAKISLPI